MTERTIYVIRHGSTELNEAGRIRGWSNVALSELGKREVERLGKQLANSNIGVIFCSDLDRARDTAEAVARTTGAKVYPTELLRPWNLGDYTGRSSSVVHPDIVRLAENEPNKATKGGESFNAFKKRAFEGLRWALVNSDGLPLALVTHHRVERLLNAWTELGQPSDHALDLAVMFEHGEDPAHAEQLPIYLPSVHSAYDPLCGEDVEGPETADGGEREHARA